LEKGEERLKRREEHRSCDFCYFPGKGEPNFNNLIVNHLFLIGIEFGEDWDGFEN